MKLSVHIEQLILEGLPITTLQGPQIQGAIESELVRLLAARGLSDELRQGASVPKVSAGTIRLTENSRPAKLGQRIARAVHEGIGYSHEQQAKSVRLLNAQGIPR